MTTCELPQGQAIHADGRADLAPRDEQRRQPAGRRQRPERAACSGSLSSGHGYIAESGATSSPPFGTPQGPCPHPWLTRHVAGTRRVGWQQAHPAGPDTCCCSSARPGRSIASCAAWTLRRHRYRRGRACRPRSVGLALLAAALSYAVLWRSTIRWRCITSGRPLPLRQGALAGFVGYAFSHAMGLPLLTGGAVRYRLYTAWGLRRRRDRRHRRLQQPDALARRRRHAGAGRARRAGRDRRPPRRCRRWPRSSALVLVPGRAARPMSSPGVFVRRPLRVATGSSPGPRRAGRLRAARAGRRSTGRWRPLTLWVLLPPVGLGFFAFAGLFTAASIAGVISHVPAGLGVFEAVLLVALPEGAHAPGVAAALIAYRLIYYLLPLLLAACAVRGAPGAGAAARSSPAGSISRAAAPSWCCPTSWPMLVFIGGTVLLISGATPTVPERLEWLAPLAPLAADRAVAFPRQPRGPGAAGPGARSAPAAGRRLVGDVRGAGAPASCSRWSRALDWEEALYLALVLAVLLPVAPAPSTARAACWRSASPPRGCSRSWPCCSAPPGSGFFCYRHVDYAQRAVVAVRARRRCAALPARHRRRDDRHRRCSAGCS